ncbi:AAA family ATPase [Kitasatospora sp. KL5]|uniref:helix-turn-helix transcriptional regulator n=1 Tax=Kitasatospora sp. KL5 TaxID=3425125 RepID=UPI003D6FCBA9
MHGRETEIRVLDGLVGRARTAEGGVLLLCGPPGAGRTALADRAVRTAAAAGALTVTAHGHPAETGLPYAALDLLAAELTAAALAAAASTAGPAEDAEPAGAPAAAHAGRLLGLLRALTARRPVLLAVDDVHHWDEPSRAALAVAARRLGPRCPAALLLTADTHHGPDPHLDGLPRLDLGPLPAAAAAALVREAAPGPVAPTVLEALLREAHGRPALLAELLARLTPAQLSGRALLPSPLPAVPLLQRYTARLAALPDAERTALLTLALAEETAAFRPDLPHPALFPDPDRPVGGLATGLAAAGLAGIVQDGGDRPRFTEPLWQSAVHRSATAADRRTAHRRLARATAETGPRLAHLWHAAAAAPGPDPAAADALDAAVRAAGPTVPPGQLAALLGRAAELGPQTVLAADRWARAAEQARLAGDTGRARLLLARARRLPADHTVRGRAAYTLGMAELSDGPVRQARATLGLAADLLADAEPDLARDARLHAAEAAWTAGDRAGCRAETAELLRRPEPAGRTAAVPAVMLHSARGTAAALDRHYSRSIPELRRTVADGHRETRPPALARALAAAAVLGDAAAARDLAARAIALARAHGHEAAVPHLLQRLAYAELYAGLPERAEFHASEGLAVAERTGRRNPAAHHHAVLALTAATRGDAAECAEHAAAADRTAVTHGLVTATVVSAWALARRDATAGRHDRAATRLLALTAPGPAQGHFALRLLAVPCLVEACVRAGRTEEARPAVREFSAWASGGAGEHARALAARCRALLAEADGGAPDTVVDLHHEALALHAAADSVLEQARTALQLGKVLRRRRHPGRARHHLREALDGFEHCGARPWAEEARTELRAAGADHGGPVVRTPVGALTAQQAHIARKAADGATNNEIARQLSLSPRTVEHHLRNIFATLGIRSRTQLGPVLAARHA